MEIGIESLYEVFGLCPDYKLVRTEGKWVEFYTLPENLPMWNKPVDDALTDKINVGRKRLHLDLHTVETERGIKLSAEFAVYHPTSTIFLRITNPTWDFRVN